VRRNSRSGVCRFRAHAVRPENAGGRLLRSPLLLVALHHLRPSEVVRVPEPVLLRDELLDLPVDLRIVQRCPPTL
jgi:hypothetical protein